MTQVKPALDLDEDDKPPGIQLSPQITRFYQRNGLAKLFNQLRLKVVSDLVECRQLWDQFSPKQSLFDTWEFRYAFWLGYQHKPHFITIKAGTETVAVMPLWYEKDKRRYFWFGSWWQEDNRFFTKKPELIPFILAACPTPTYLNAITPDTLSCTGPLIELSVDDPKFVLDLTKISSLDNFLSHFHKKRRYNLKRDKRIIEAQTPQIIFDRFTDFKHLVALSQERFRQKGEDTDWEDPRRVAAFRQVIKLGQKKLSYSVRMITIMIGKQIAGVDLVAIYKDCYYPIKCGYDVVRFPGIGNYFNLLEIEDALSLGIKKMDFLEIDYGWKHKWFEEAPLYFYDNQPL